MKHSSEVKKNLHKKWDNQNKEMILYKITFHNSKIRKRIYSIDIFSIVYFYVIHVIEVLYGVKTH